MALVLTQIKSTFCEEGLVVHFAVTLSVRAEKQHRQSQQRKQRNILNIQYLTSLNIYTFTLPVVPTQTVQICQR